MYGCTLPNNKEEYPVRYERKDERSSLSGTDIAVLTSMPGLRQALGNNLYKVVLEISCGNQITYQILARLTAAIYIGFNTNTHELESLQTFYERHQTDRNFPLSKFFKRNALSLKGQGALFFDLICVHSLQTFMTTRQESELRIFLIKLLKRTRKLIVHVIVSEDMGCYETIRMPLACFFPLTLYQCTAVECGRSMYVVKGEIFEYSGTTLETKYLVFE